jgi:[ribosomal protein S5]-alanine N-acetyltransferase
VIALRTARLELVPITLPLVEAVILGRRDTAESLALARMPEPWPNRELVEQAFSVSMEDIRANPSGRLWGARMMVVRGSNPRRVIGSVVFRSAPDHGGIAEIAYGVEGPSQGQGYATEAVNGSVDWALAEPLVRAVQAATFAWHRASVRVLEKVGMVPSGTRHHETMGEMLIFERRASTSPRPP